MIYLEIDTLIHFILGHFEMKKNTKEIHDILLKQSFQNIINPLFNFLLNNKLPHK